MTESPDDACPVACPIVLQAVVADLQSLLSLPVTPFTYHVLLAEAGDARAKNRARSEKLTNCLRFMMFPFFAVLFPKPAGQGVDPAQRNQ
jgi:hypothetical protein